MQLSDTLRVDDAGWRFVETGWDTDRAVAVGSNFMVGNGYLGYRATSPEQGADDFVALVVTDTYDCADGHWRELCTVPNPLFVGATIDGTAVGVTPAESGDTEMSLDLRTGMFGARFDRRIGEHRVHVEVERFASYDELHLLAQRWTLTADAANPGDVDLEVGAGVDTTIWSLNGVHLPDVSLDRAGDGAVIARGSTVESGVDIVVAAHPVLTGGTTLAATAGVGDDVGLERTRLTLAAGGQVVVETVAAVVTSNDDERPADVAADIVGRAATEGFDGLLARSARRWAQIWNDIDVVIDGDVADQAALRFSAYHNRICTPAHTDRLPIGARGLSCQAYQGAAFWDQEIYNLPAFLFTEPEIARSILVYRHHTLDGARRKADRLGYRGAFYAWISGTTGDELCPDYFFVDVLTGRPIRNHFNVWQMHVSPDIVTTIARYVEVTGDVDFLVEHGAEITFEVARFLHSFVRYDEVRGTYSCIRLLGPDEWHENVDDNAFTNHQAQRALAFAVATHERLAADRPDALATIGAAIGLEPGEVDGWRRVRDHIVLPQPGPDGLIEQFAGFFTLEDVTPDVVRERLIHPEEYWGWPNGVAVHTQVAKQADIAMLLWLHADRFDADTIRRNYDYYEARCAHGSSLSHAAHGMVAARIGATDDALRHFRETATTDLLNTQHAVVGGTFIGGVHTAACGGTYQLAVEGFGGLGAADGRLTVDPALPDAWTSLTFPVAWRGQRLRVTVVGDGVEIAADPANTADVEVAVTGRAVAVPPGGRVAVRTV